MLKTIFEFFDKNKAVITLMSSILLTVLKEFFDESIIRNILTYLAIGLFVALLVILIRTFIKEKQQENNGMSNNIVIKKTKEHCKTLDKYAKIVRRKLNKNTEMTDFQKNKLEEKQILRKLSGKSVPEDSKQALEEQLTNIIDTYNHRETIKLIKKLEADKCFLVSQLLTNKLFDLNRMLLNAEQFSLRIKFGEFLRDYSLNEEHRVSAYIDFIGWSRMLQGHTEKGEKAIKSGLELAKKIVKNSKDEAQKNKFTLYIARGYRHLGSARKTLERDPEKAIKYLEVGKRTLNKLNESSEGYNKDSVLQMNAGLEYGIVDAKYNLFVSNKRKHRITKIDFLDFYENYLLFEDLIKKASSFSNKHRAIKFRLLEIKYLEKMKKQQKFFQTFIKDFNLNIKDINIKIKESLRAVEDVFKNNIFMDESIEHYFDEHIRYFKHEMTEILLGGKQ